MGMGAGPTPALWHAAPQKPWSPKNGTMKVGLPEEFRNRLYVASYNSKGRGGGGGRRGGMDEARPERETTCLTGLQVTEGCGADACSHATPKHSSLFSLVITNQVPCSLPPLMHTLAALSHSLSVALVAVALSIDTALSTLSLSQQVLTIVQPCGGGASAAVVNQSRTARKQPVVRRLPNEEHLTSARSPTVPVPRGHAACGGGGGRRRRRMPCTVT